MKFKRRCQAKKCRNHDVSILKMYSCMHCVFLGCRAHAEVHFKEANHPVGMYGYVIKCKNCL